MKQNRFEKDKMCKQKQRFFHIDLIYTDKILTL